MPAMSPPPPIGTTIASRSGASASISRRDGALARHHRRVVVGVDEREALGRREPVRLLRRLVEGLAEQHHPGAVAARCSRPSRGACRRHDDGRRDAEAPRMIGDRLGVVARRHRDDAPLGVRRRRGFRACSAPALLEGAGRLHVLVLDEDRGTGQLGEARGRHERRAQDAPSICGGRSASARLMAYSGTCLPPAAKPIVAFLFYAEESAGWKA